MSIPWPSGPELVSFASTKSSLLLTLVQVINLYTRILWPEVGILDL